MIRSAFNKAVLLPLLALALLACGNDPKAGLGGIKASDLTSSLKAVIAARRNAANPIQQDPAQIRALLAQNNLPVMFFKREDSAASGYLFPIGMNNGVQTWTSPERQTVSLRSGVLVATRGFGSDIMAARVPTAAQLAAGLGRTSRDYLLLDGADQQLRMVYECTLSSRGAETIVVVGRSHNTRHVVESCTGSWGSFTNHYWFEGGNIRQSSQLLVLGVGNLTLQRIID